MWVLAVPGGLALLLAAIFALREAILAGYVGPGVRFALGAGVATLAIFAGEIARWRRHDVVAAALSGAGAGVAYATLYAGHARYGLVGQELTFVLMAVTTAVTLFAAERRNSRFMASLALVGGYLTPILLSTGENKAVAFFGYLALLDAGLLMAALRRRWTTLIAIAGVVTAAMYVGWAATFRAPEQVTTGLVVPVVLSALFFLPTARRSTAMSEAVATGLSGLLLLACGVIFVVPVDLGRYDRLSGLPLPTDDVLAAGLGLAYLGTLLVPFGIARRLRAAWLEVGAHVGMLLLLAAYVIGQAIGPEPRWALVVAACLLAPVIAAITVAGGWFVPLLASALLFAGVALPAEAPAPWGAVVGAGLTLLGAGLAAWRGPRPTLPFVAVGAALPVLVPLALEAPSPGAWLLGTAVVYAAFAFPPFLRPRAGDLWGALGAAVIGPAVFLPFHRLWTDALGSGFIGLLPVILGMVALFAAGALVRAVRVRADDRELALLMGVVLLFAALAVPLQLEEAWLTVGWAVEIALLGLLSRRLTHWLIPAFGAVLAAAVSVRLLVNPSVLVYGDTSGWPILNWTLYTWGIPGVCLLVAAWAFRVPILSAALRTAAMFVFFALVNLEIAHAFARAGRLSFWSDDLGESMTRSISWAVYGLLIITIGAVRDSRRARLAGLGFALLGALKVFAVDLWSLSGFARVGSFAGLAVTLLVGAVAFSWLVLRKPK